MSCSAVKVTKLSQNVVKIKRNNAKSCDRINGFERKVEWVRSVERLACVILEVVSPRLKSLGAHVKKVVTKYLKTVEETTHVKEERHVCIASLESLHKAEIDCIARFEMDRAEKHA